MPLIRLCCIPLLAAATLLAEGETPAPLSSLMPRAEDFTRMFWAEGFPARVPGARWERVIRTGSYAFAMETDTLRITHLGALSSEKSYASSAFSSDLAWKQLPPAKLSLEIAVNGRNYRATGASKWTQFDGPRLIESGRFFQRADITGLVFSDDQGNRLNTDARLEVAAWPDRLTFTLAARPGLEEIKPGKDGSGSKPRSSARWDSPSLDMVFSPHEGNGLGAGTRISGSGYTHEGSEKKVWITINPLVLGSPSQKTKLRSGGDSRFTVSASEIPTGKARPVSFVNELNCHRVDLDGIVPIVPPGPGDRRNDALERVRLILANPSDTEQPARLLFAKEKGGFRHSVGSAITGVTAVLRDRDGRPTGLPVQLSKNWHNRPEGGVHSGLWFHGFSMVRLPPRSTTELELTLAYGHWGSVPAASHAQLSLVGWGSNQLWDEAAVGSWGESVCFEPDQVQASALVTDVRPLMVKGMGKNETWGWTHNVGGSDFFRLFTPDGQRVPPSAMRTTYLKQGPCLTEVVYSGKLGAGLDHSVTASLARTDDLTRATYRLRLDAREATAFSRFVLFQIGADTYSYTGERLMAFGNSSGLTREWPTQWGGEVYRTKPVELAGPMPWVSLHQAVARRDKDQKGAWANRGLVIRSWKARLGGRDAASWFAERGVKARGSDTSTVDLIPPPGVTRLEPGDFVEAVIEHLVIPQSADDYYGPNEALRKALQTDADTWRMIHREARQGARVVEVSHGVLEGLYPAVKVRAIDNAAAFTLAGGTGFVPVTLTGLTSASAPLLTLDGHKFDQSVHGHDFWQMDYDPEAKTWSVTYNLSARESAVEVRFKVGK